MGQQTYDPVNQDDVDRPSEQESSALLEEIPDSPPPSFRSTSPSSPPTNTSRNVFVGSGLDTTLEDTFDMAEDSDVEGDNRQRSIFNSSGADWQSHPNPLPPPSHSFGRNEVHSTPTTSTSSNIRGPSASANDGVFANLSAKPEAGEKIDEQPPSYEQAAADATPPYWETTIFTPGMLSDEVYIDGLPVGSFFSFAWNGIISMAFQLVGFLLTYLLHTTHAARHGSRAGLGVTLINYGFRMRSVSSQRSTGHSPVYDAPTDPGDHQFDPSNTNSRILDVEPTHSDTASTGLSSGEWLTYALMIVGWIILIKAIADFIKARRHEQLILQSPNRVHNVGIGEGAESAV